VAFNIDGALRRE